ncbi:MAG: hypothetical protein GY696_10495 [Gammaproteobacteria bacterium]|nr:hypothetical protein [Gammaproteobacteria bacterium]
MKKTGNEQGYFAFNLMDSFLPKTAGSTKSPNKQKTSKQKNMTPPSVNTLGSMPPIVPPMTPPDQEDQHAPYDSS